ncbi:MAG TPA: dUTP diphosphatase [Oligoflexia bacterium]|nr:dUTP diphosphatase [Oligoflexia bacterium]
MTTQLPVQKLNPDARLPGRAHPGDAGLDLFCIGDVTLNPHEPAKVATGIAMAIPEGHVGLICDRSSMGAKGIRTLGGVVDAGYRGEVQVLLINLRNEPYKISRGDKIAQMLILPVNLIPTTEVKELSDTVRSSGGFGSTGR